MYDQAFYDAAAERIPASTFATLRQEPTIIDATALDSPTVGIRFTPGDSTLYEVLISRMTNQEAVVVVANMRLVFRVPWGDGAYVHHGYIGGQAIQRSECTWMAVAAVVNRAIDVCHDAAGVS